jgi:hypothetical protein
MYRSIAVLSFCALLSVNPAWSQAGLIVKKGAKGVRPKSGAQKAKKQQVDRFSAMSAEERQKALSRLPPRRRQEIERRLEQYRSMPPEERERLMREAAVITPAQRRAMREGIERMGRLPDERRPVVRQEVARLRRMSAEERKARLVSEPFKNGFNSEERKLIEDISENLPGPASQ